MKRLTINHFALAAALLLHGALLLRGSLWEPVPPEPERQITIRFASIETETAPRLAPLQEALQQKAEPLPAREEKQSIPPPEPAQRQEPRPVRPPAPMPAPQAPADSAPAAIPAPRQVQAVAAPARNFSPTAAPSAAPQPGAETWGGLPKGESAAASKPAARLADYLTLVRGMVENNRDYPATARQLGLQGTVTVRVSIRGDGSIQEVRIAESAGHKSLDKAALNAVRRAAPFRHPGGFGLGEVTVEIPIVYRLT